MAATAGCIRRPKRPTVRGPASPAPPGRRQIRWLVLVAWTCAGAVVCAAAHARGDAPGFAPEVPARERLPLGRPDQSRRLSPGVADGSVPAGGTVRTTLSLGLVLTLVLGGAWAVRMLARVGGGLRAALGPGGKAPAGVLEVLGRYPIARGSSLVLLKLDRRVLLLAQSPAGRFGGCTFTTLCDISNPEEVASLLVRTRDAEGESLAAQFRSLMARAGRSLDAAERHAGREPVEIEPGWDAARAAIPVVDLTGRPGSGPQGAGAALRRRLGTWSRSGRSGT